ncbi:MAG: AAA family ATPase [Spirochaetaceae bacterium]|nr:AAA family ATPase [Spirochaetaceae bacterium]
MHPRRLDVRKLATRKSLFLFGPRGTGKTTLLRQQFGPRAIVDLLRSSVYLPLAENPSRLHEIVVEGRVDATTEPQVVVIDGVQKLPQLLDEVHDLIETERIHFVLSGSSGRRLKRGGANLLGGRAWQVNLFPLTSAELADIDLGQYLLHGGLPQVYDAQRPEEELDGYVSTYLAEEIQAEGLAQNFTHFARFLNVAAVSNGQQLNFANMSRDAGVPATSVRSYVEILADTFIGFLLPPWRGSRRRKAVATAKFYFFGVGVANFLRGTRMLNRNSSEYAIAFEHFIAMELRSYLSYRRIRSDLPFWRTQSGLEVDFLIGSSVAIEVKESGRVFDRDLRGLRALAEEDGARSSFLVSFDELDRRTDDGIRLLHWRTFLDELWSDGLPGSRGPRGITGAPTEGDAGAGGRHGSQAQL